MVARCGCDLSDVWLYHRVMLVKVRRGSACQVFETEEGQRLWMEFTGASRGSSTALAPPIAKNNEFCLHKMLYARAARCARGHSIRL